MWKPRPRIRAELISYYAMHWRAISSFLIHTLTALIAFIIIFNFRTTFCVLRCRPIHF